ncbi:esterase [Streptomyces cinereoruber]|uniref:Class A beta-lactamase-related serine hydrolase n=1 Tax=Streptomyces cinereoruber TaxID=67260 RepID=A0AAV4KNP3_9ACTN|nr:serine hydrolase domain-containing protein [Streptomyces cinereoruber]MBB4160184.1 CubicO group peptidase (beta-lactamase class C family) [Streptomyces cinereoruber]MBY8818208.1 beta-lactamase family protein [Streptomyces cinereoruber]NIH61121.1 CubicO group peptidase (beta-lactamase class C family) [Streptomyces cinereoruber]QEV33182.1 class A beta-lactamase-related serine hydrolase [Streptomyces cinereoruber]GGR38694.1 esterase [Streptomyces cinereoruber]
MDVRGTVAAGWEPVRDAFLRNFEQRGERGAAVAVHRDGVRVVDLWAGAKDGDGEAAEAGGGGADGAGAGGGAPWTEDTAQVVRSATKGVAAAVPLLLHQRGLLDLDAPVAAYWPEFKAAGKDRATVRDLLAHRAGVPVLDRPLTLAEAADLPTATAAIAAQAPVWEPGTAHGYHAHTFSWLLSGLVHRVTGRTVGRWVAEEIADPLGLDLWIGLPDAEAHRVGRIGPVEEVEPPGSGALRLRPKRAVTEAYRDPDSLTRRAFGVIDPKPDENDPAYRAAELPGSAGVATARALSRFYAATLGPVDGAERLFAPETLALARTEESAGPDRVLLVGTRFGLGHMLHGPASPLLGPSSFGHPGRGGSLGFADPDSGTAFGYVTNGMRKTVTADPRAQALVRAVAAVAGVGSIRR